MDPKNFISELTQRCKELDQFDPMAVAARLISDTNSIFCRAFSRECVDITREMAAIISFRDEVIAVVHEVVNHSDFGTYSTYVYDEFLKQFNTKIEEMIQGKIPVVVKPNVVSYNIYLEMQCSDDGFYIDIRYMVVHHQKEEHEVFLEQSFNIQPMMYELDDITAIGDEDDDDEEE